MNLFDRMLLALYTFCLTIALLLFLFILTDWITLPNFLSQVKQLPVREVVLWVLIGLFIIIGIRLFWVSFQQPRKRNALIRDDVLGRVRISLQALESLVERTVFQTSGVREVKTKILPAQEGIGVQVRVVVTPDLNIPETSTEIQNNIKEKILLVTGIPVRNVEIEVENISISKSRVE